MNNSTDKKDFKRVFFYSSEIMFKPTFTLRTQRFIPIVMLIPTFI